MEPLNPSANDYSKIHESGKGQQAAIDPDWTAWIDDDVLFDSEAASRPSGLDFASYVQSQTPAPTPMVTFSDMSNISSVSATSVVPMPGLEFVPHVPYSPVSPASHPALPSAPYPSYSEVPYHPQPHLPQPDFGNAFTPSAIHSPGTLPHTIQLPSPKPSPYEPHASSSSLHAEPSAPGPSRRKRGFRGSGSSVHSTQSQAAMSINLKKLHKYPVTNKLTVYAQDIFLDSSYQLRGGAWVDSNESDNAKQLAQEVLNEVFGAFDHKQNETPEAKREKIEEDCPLAFDPSSQQYQEFVVHRLYTHRGKMRAKAETMFGLKRKSDRSNDDKETFGLFKPDSNGNEASEDIIASRAEDLLHNEERYLHDGTKDKAGKFVKNYCNPTIIKVALAGYSGSGNSMDTKRSFVTGINDYTKEYGHTIPEKSFVNTVPDEAYAMAAAVVRYVLTCLSSKQYPAKGGFNYTFRRYYLTIGDEIALETHQNEKVAKYRARKLSAHVEKVLQGRA